MLVLKPRALYQKSSYCMNMGEIKICFTLPDQDQAVTLYFRDKNMAREPLL